MLNILETKDLSKLDVKDTKEIEKQLRSLRDQIEKTDSKKTSLTTYSEYEKKVARNKRKLKDKLKNKKELEEALKGLEDSLKIKKRIGKKLYKRLNRSLKGFEVKFNLQLEKLLVNELEIKEAAGNKLGSVLKNSV